MKSREKIGLLIGLLFMGLMATAQEDGLAERRFGLSILAGFNAAQIDGDDSAGFNKVGVHAGLRTDIFLTEKTELGVGIIFSQRGSRPDPKNEPALDFKIGTSFIQVPVLFTFKDWYQQEDKYHRVRAFAGFSFGRLIDTNLDDTAFDERPELF